MVDNKLKQLSVLWQFWWIIPRITFSWWLDLIKPEYYITASLNDILCACVCIYMYVRVSVFVRLCVYNIQVSNNRSLYHLDPVFYINMLPMLRSIEPEGDDWHDDTHVMNHYFNITTARHTKSWEFVPNKQVPCHIIFDARIYILVEPTTNCREIIIGVEM